MAVYYYPFESHETGDESNPYDRAITAEQERMFNKLRYVNGVFNPDGGALRVTSNSNMTVTVGTGGCHIEGAIAYSDAPITLPIEAANATLNRIDRVVAQFNTSDSVRAINFIVRTGTAATNPIAPELRKESNLYEIALADIYVGKNVSSIGTANITDLRLNSDLCGFVVPAIPTPLDLSGIYNQYQASLNEWLDTVAAALDGTLAGNLQSQITALDTRMTTEEGKIQPILLGGTGASDRAMAMKNLAFLGTNPIASPDDDTIANWVSLGTGFAYISGAGKLNNQPTNYGYLVNICNPTSTIVYQTFYSMNGNSPVWHRLGNSNGWYSGSANWVKSLDENSGIQMKLLWTNASPTSAFAAQTISLDLSDYDEVEIVYRAYGWDGTIEITGNKSVTISVGDVGILDNAAMADSAAYYTIAKSRKATVNEAGVHFLNGYVSRVNNAPNLDNKSCIPQKIYGIKGVQ